MTDTVLIERRADERPQPTRYRSFAWSRAVGLLGAGLAAIGLAGADSTQIDSLGLLRVPPLLYYAGVALLLIGLVEELSVPRKRMTWFAVLVTLLVVLLHGLPGFVEANPRFSTAYTHVGFIDQIASQGTLLPRLDARFSWPSFFSGGAVLQEVSGGGPVLWLVRFMPVVINLLAIAAILVLGRACGSPVQTARAAAVLYALLNWVGQDYLSPQAVGFVLYLAIMCCVLVVFPGDPSDTRRWQRRWLHPRSRPGAGPTARGQGRCLLGLTMLAAVGVTAHQLTPGFLAASLILLGLLNQTRLRALGWSVVLMTAGWLGYAAEVFWRGQLNKVVGSFVQVDVLVQQNLGKRTGGSAGREVVVAGRLGLALVLAAATLVALAVLWRRRDVPVALATLVAAPIPMLLAAAYGGEMALRVFFFALPAASLLVAQVACPEGMWTRTRQVIVSAALVALVPLFVLARFGNESFEQVTPQDRAMLSTVYDVAPDNSIVYQLNSISIQRFERLDEVRFRTLNASLDAKALTKTVADSEPFTGRFIMVTHSQEEQGVELGGESPGWSAEIVAELLATGSFETVRRDGDAVLLRYIGSTG